MNKVDVAREHFRQWQQEVCDTIRNRLNLDGEVFFEAGNGQPEFIDPRRITTDRYGEDMATHKLTDPPQSQEPVKVDLVHKGKVQIVPLPCRIGDREPAWRKEAVRNHGFIGEHAYRCRECEGMECIWSLKEGEKEMAKLEGPFWKHIADMTCHREGCAIHEKDCKYGYCPTCAKQLTEKIYEQVRKEMADTTVGHKVRQ